MKKQITFLVINLITMSNLYNQKALTKNKAFTKQVVLFSGNANLPLATKVAEYLNMPLGSAIVSKFNDGEIQIHINNSVRDKDVFIIQSTCPSEKQSINDNLMELYLLIRTMKRSSAKSITAVIPYYGYARQDRKTSPRVPISAADVALMIETAGIDRLLTVDLHCGQIQGFFHNVPVDNLYAASVFIPHLLEKKLNKVVVVAPDAGGVERATRFVNSLNKKGIDAEMAIISKQRASAGVISAMHLIGDVKGADTIIVDDICDTAGTLVKAAELLKENGATKVYAILPHAVFSGNALDKIRNSVIDEMMIADTIPLRGNIPSNLTTISISELLGEAIRHIFSGESVSGLFE